MIGEKKHTDLRKSFEVIQDLLVDNVISAILDMIIIVRKSPLDFVDRID